MSKWQPFCQQNEQQNLINKMNLECHIIFRNQSQHTKAGKNPHNFNILSYYYRPIGTNWQTIKQLYYISNGGSHSTKQFYY